MSVTEAFAAARLIVFSTTCLIHHSFDPMTRAIVEGSKSHGVAVRDHDGRLARTTTLRSATICKALVTPGLTSAGARMPRSSPLDRGTREDGPGWPDGVIAPPCVLGSR